MGNKHMGCRRARFLSVFGLDFIALSLCHMEERCPWICMQLCSRAMRVATGLSRLALHVVEIVRAEVAGCTKVAVDPAAQRELNTALDRVAARLMSEIGCEELGINVPSISAGALRQRRYRERQRASRVTIIDAT